MGISTQGKLNLVSCQGLQLWWKLGLRRGLRLLEVSCMGSCNVSSSCLEEAPQQCCPCAFWYGKVQFTLLQLQSTYNLRSKKWSTLLHLVIQNVHSRSKTSLSLIQDVRKLYILVAKTLCGGVLTVSSRCRKTRLLYATWLMSTLCCKCTAFRPGTKRQQSLFRASAQFLPSRAGVRIPKHSFLTQTL